MEIIRYKFMSCATFETLNIAPHSSISLRDLKTEIVLRTGLDLRRDSLLIFSEDFTVAGGELTDDDTQIHSGSGVILKRIPAESPPPDRKSYHSAGQTGNGDDDFVNFVELHVLNLGLPEFDFEDVSYDSEEVKDCPVERCSGEVRGEKLEGTFPVESNPQDSSPNAVGTSTIQLETMAQEHTNLDSVVGDLPVGGEMLEPTLPVHDSNPNATGELMLISQGQTNMDRTAGEKVISGRGFGMLSEFKCSLCSTFFKDAVMIPCCQHSFCRHCISLALIENSTCPKCSSNKCKPEDLLPNRTLRDAIDRFLELQGLQDDVGRDAPENVSFQGAVPCSAPQHWSHNMYCGPEMMVYNTMYAATTVAYSSYNSSMFSGYPVTSRPLNVGGIGTSSGMNAHQRNQIDLYSYQQGFHTEAFKRGKNLPRPSEAKEIVPNDQLDKTTSEKVKHDRQRREKSLRYSKRNEKMRPQHASDSSQNHHYSSNKESIPRRRMDDDRRSYREYYGRSSSGVECAYSSGSGRRGQDEPGPESRHSQKYSKRNGKDIYHERGRMTKYSNDDYEEDYHNHKRKR